MARFFHSDGYVIDNDRDNMGYTQVHVEQTNRWYKVYYEDTYRADASPYIKINGHKYYLDEFLREI